MGAAEVVQQLLVGGRLLQHVELAAVQVLQQRVAQHRVVGGLLDDGRHALVAGIARSAPPPLAHDQLVVPGTVGHRTNHDGLQHAEFSDARHEFAELVRVEHGPRLAGVRANQIDRDLGVPSTGHLPQPAVVLSARVDIRRGSG